MMISVGSCADQTSSTRTRTTTTRSRIMSSSSSSFPVHRYISIALFLLLLLLLVPISVVDARSVLGVDLGTSYMKVALVRSGSPLEIVTNMHSKRKTEQLVLFDQKQRFFGADANGLLQRKSQLTPASMTEFLGRDVTHPNIQVSMYVLVVLVWLCCCLLVIQEPFLLLSCFSPTPLPPLTKTLHLVKLMK